MEERGLPHYSTCGILCTSELSRSHAHALVGASPPPVTRLQDNRKGDDLNRTQGSEHRIVGIGGDFITLKINQLRLKRCYLPLMLQQSKFRTHSVMIQTTDPHFLFNLVFRLIHLLSSTCVCYEINSQQSFVVFHIVTMTKDELVTLKLY